MRRRTLLTLAALAATSSPAFAQTQPATRRIRGRVVALSGQTLDVMTREGQPATLTLTPDFAVSEVTPLPLEAIKPNSFVGVTSIHVGDKDVALEVTVFPESARGAGEGSRPWDLQPDSTMTNATVGTVTSHPDGPIIALAYKGGTKTIIIPPDAPIVTFGPADRSLLVPGAPVVITATVGADGAMTASRITTGRNGVAPPM